MNAPLLLEKMREHASSDALIVRNTVYSYGDLLDLGEAIRSRLDGGQLPRGAVVSFPGDYTAEAVALFLVLMNHGCILVPLSPDSEAQQDQYREIATTEYHVAFADGIPVLSTTGRKADHPHYRELRRRNRPGLVLFSSGSTGMPKGIVQDLDRLLAKFQAPRNPLRMLIFLQLDHIGGINSLFHALTNGGTAIAPHDRSPAAVCEAIERHRADLLPTSPTFLNLLLCSRAYENHDLSSLKLVTYGTEPMPHNTLAQFSRLFPHVALQQTYGTSELGILRSRSRDSGSLWVKVGGPEFETRVVDNRLWVKSRCAMLGYLHEASPFDEEGFFDTGDVVEQDGEWLRILGRQSEVINVGGLKVFPAEVESVLLEMPNVEDAVVFGEDHALTGKVVAARIRLQQEEGLKEFKTRMRRFMKSRLQPYKVPARVVLSREALHSERFKRVRRATTDSCEGQ